MSFCYDKPINCYWPFVGRIHQLLHKGHVMQNIYAFFDVHVDKQINKQWSCW